MQCAGYMLYRALVSTLMFNIVTHYSCCIAVSIYLDLFGDYRENGENIPVSGTISSKHNFQHTSIS